MSLKNWGCRISASKSKVIDCLKKFAKHVNGQFRESSDAAEQEQDNLCIMISALDDNTCAIGWFESGLVPQMVLYLSKELKTKVLAVDQQENIGYQHFCEIDKGKVVRLYTDCDDVLEEINLPDEYLIDIAERKESKRFASIIRENPRFKPFDLLLSEHDMQLFPLEELFEAEDVEYYEIVAAGVGQQFMGSWDLESGSTKGRFWFDLVPQKK